MKSFFSELAFFAVTVALLGVVTVQGVTLVKAAHDQAQCNRSEYATGFHSAGCTDCHKAQAPKRPVVSKCKCKDGCTCCPKCGETCRPCPEKCAKDCQCHTKPKAGETPKQLTVIVGLLVAKDLVNDGLERGQKPKPVSLTFASDDLAQTAAELVMRVVRVSGVQGCCGVFTVYGIDPILSPKMPPVK